MRLDLKNLNLLRDLKVGERNQNNRKDFTLILINVNTFIATIFAILTSISFMLGFHFLYELLILLLVSLYFVWSKYYLLLKKWKIARYIFISGLIHSLILVLTNIMPENFYSVLIFYTLTVLYSYLMLAPVGSIIVTGLTTILISFLGPIRFFYEGEISLTELFVNLNTIFVYMFSVSFSLHILMNRFEDNLKRIAQDKERLKQEIKFREQAEKSVLEEIKKREEIFTNMSHEVRTPLSSIVGLAELLDETKLSRQQKKYTESLKNSAKTILSIVSEILDYSSLSERKINTEVGNIKEHLTEIVESFKFQYKQKGIKLIMKIDPEISKYVYFDKQLFDLVVFNLVQNALKFTNNGLVEIILRKKSKSEKTTTLEFTVKDTGIGIPEDKISTIFESYKQVDSSIKRKNTGSGLGLSIVKLAIEIMKGRINVDSIENKGSTFSVTFDVKKADYVVHEKKKNKKVKVKDVILKNIKILIVEDNSINQLVAKKLLEKKNAICRIVESGIDALTLLESESFDIVLLDIQMPFMDGYTTATKIRKELKLNIPIIAVSAHISEFEKRKAFNVGIDEYVIKPFAPDILYQKVFTLVKASE